MTHSCGCGSVGDGRATCETLPTATTYPVEIPVTKKMQERMRAAGWAPVAETIAAMNTDDGVTA